MEYEQQKRFDKLATDEFFFLHASKDAAADVVYRVNLVGSTKNIYQAMVHADRTFFCNCPDGKTHAARHGVVCKHVCFLVQRVLRLDFERDLYAHGYALDATKWDAATARLDRLVHGEVDRAVTHDGLIAKWHAVMGDKAKVMTEVTTKVTTDAVTTDKEAWVPLLAALDKLTEDDVCAICFAEYVPAHPATAAMAAELEACARCKGYVHSKCMAKWVSMGRAVCVNCNQAYAGLEVAPGSKPKSKEPTRFEVERPAAKRRRVATDADYVNLG